MFAHLLQDTQQTWVETRSASTHSVFPISCRDRSSAAEASPLVATWCHLQIAHPPIQSRATPDRKARKAENRPALHPLPKAPQSAGKPHPKAFKRRTNRPPPRLRSKTTRSGAKPDPSLKRRTNRPPSKTTRSGAKPDLKVLKGEQQTCSAPSAKEQSLWGQAYYYNPKALKGERTGLLCDFGRNPLHLGSELEKENEPASSVTSVEDRSVWGQA